MAELRIDSLLCAAVLRHIVQNERQRVGQRFDAGRNEINNGRFLFASVQILFAQNRQEHAANAASVVVVATVATTAVAAESLFLQNSGDFRIHNVGDDSERRRYENKKENIYYVEKVPQKDHNSHSLINQLLALAKLTPRARPYISPQPEAKRRVPLRRKQPLHRGGQSQHITVRFGTQKTHPSAHHQHTNRFQAHQIGLVLEVLQNARDRTPFRAQQLHEIVANLVQRRQKCLQHSRTDDGRRQFVAQMLPARTLSEWDGPQILLVSNYPAQLIPCIRTNVRGFHT